VTGLAVRTAATGRRGRALLVVEADGVEVAWVEVARPRRRLTPAPGAPPAGAPTAEPHPGAWSAAAASRAAAARWRDPHPAVRTVWQVRSTAGEVRPLAALLEAVGDHLADDGVRRLDVRVGASDPAALALHGERWVQGRVGGDVVASLAIAHPWATAPRTDGRLHALLAPLPPRLQRTVRRAAAVHPAQVPELARSVATEAWVTARHRSAPGAARSVAVSGAPKGSHPFAASRYRTVRAALSFVPPALRSTVFIDIGCGDGRVLREALAAGFPRADGRELDPELARRAQLAVGDAGTVTTGDALATPLPDDAGVVFLNNPFDSSVLRRFSGLVAETLERRSRPLLLLYLNPRPIEPLLAGGLVLVHVTPLFSIFASRATT
jgi:hypothetical protein